jgi:hypothetical protein
MKNSVSTFKKKQGHPSNLNNPSNPSNPSNVNVVKFNESGVLKKFKKAV